MAHWYHLHTIYLEYQAFTASTCNFFHCLPGGSSIVHSLCLLIVCILLLLLEQSLTLPMLPSPILNARIRREIKSINPLLGLLNLSHTVHHSPWPCNSSSQLTTCSVLFTFLSRWLWADPHHNLPNPWCLFVVHDKNLCSHL